MKRTIYILGILAFSSNSFAQIWTKPSPLVVSGLPSEYLNEIVDVILHSSGELWCKFRAYDTVQKKYTNYYIAHHTSQKEKWISPIEIPKEVCRYVQKGKLVEDKKGRIWMIAGSGLPNLFGCYYDGHSFSDLIEIPGAPTWNNHNICCCRDSAGNIWVVWTTDAWGPDCYWEVTYNWYDGEIWHSATRLTTHYSHYDYLPFSLITDKDGKVWIAWTGYGALEDPPVESYLKYYDGKEWSDSTCIPYQGGPREPKLACDSRGRIWVTWLSHYAKDTLAIYASFYKGGEWSVPILISKEVPVPLIDFYPSSVIAVDRRDRVWIAWNSNKSDSYGNIWFVYFNGKEWSEPAPIYQKPHTQYRAPSLIVDKEGKVWCWWSAIDTSITRRLHYISHTTEMGVKEESRDNTNKPKLLENFPNPFRTVTSVKWLGTGEGPISLEVYDASGRLVRTLAETQSPEPKAYTIEWDGKDDKGKKVPQGIYFLRLEAGNFAQTKKLILMR